ncbi:MAG: hypothetical protein K1X95_09960 [Acidimicrobiia bacterium]|nr:hypothetical protein [Acidimicrobiia bacterium]
MVHLLKFAGILVLVLVVWAGIDLFLFQPMGFNSAVWNVVHVAGDALSGVIHFVQRAANCMTNGCPPPT